jgi:hypothetical protein
MVSEPEVSSLNPDGRDLLKKIKKIAAYSCPTFAPKRAAHEGSVKV